MNTITDFVYRYIQEVANFLYNIHDVQQWSTEGLIATAEYLFIGWVSLLVIPRLFFRNALLQLVVKILLVILLVGLILWAHDPRWYEAYL